MSITVRKTAERGRTNLDWLQSSHSFSFGEYFDPQHMGFVALRVINDDVVQPAAGFDRHGHRDMEIITYVLSGALEHQDSMGIHTVIPAGDIQCMTAGTGVSHSEFNASNKEPVRFLQIWVEPDQKNLTPNYEQVHLEHRELANQLKLVVSQNGRDGSIQINQDANIYISKLDKDHSLSFDIEPSRALWIQLISGRVQVNDTSMMVGDGASIVSESSVVLKASDNAELMIFDMNGFDLKEKGMGA